MFGDNFAGDAGNDGRLACAPHLILRLEPVPAERRIRVLALVRIGNEKSMLLRQVVHAGSCGEVVGILRAAMQHDDQWAASDGMMTSRNVELVASPSRDAGIGPVQVLSAVGDLERLARLDSRQAIEPEAWKSRPAESCCNVAYRPIRLRRLNGLRRCGIRGDVDRERLDRPRLDSLSVLRLGRSSTQQQGALNDSRGVHQFLGAR